MKSTIYHNPACGTSRKTLAILQGTPDIDVEVVEYLKVGWDAKTLTRLFAAAGFTPAAALRTRGTDAVDRGLPAADDTTVIAAMIASPILVERPFVETAKGARLCRPQDIVREIL